MVSPNAFASVAVKSTCAPARIQAIAMYFPRPRAAPVMMMRFPVNSMCKPRLVIGAVECGGAPRLAKDLAPSFAKLPEKVSYTY